jgi:hypothetical protein
VEVEGEAEAVAEEEEVVGEEEEVDVNTSLNKYNKLLDNK